MPTVRKLQELHPDCTKCAPAILRGFPVKTSRVKHASWTKLWCL